MISEAPVAVAAVRAWWLRIRWRFRLCHVLALSPARYPVERSQRQVRRKKRWPLMPVEQAQ
jgi:hypothetical protein